MSKSVHVAGVNMLLKAYSTSPHAAITDVSLIALQEQVLIVMTAFNSAPEDSYSLLPQSSDWKL
jgi:hypothetical protein